MLGMEKSSRVHSKREALIEKIYDADEIGWRILNGDGGSWIKEIYDPKPSSMGKFHIYKRSKRRSGLQKPRRTDQRTSGAEEKVDEMLGPARVTARTSSSDPKGAGMQGNYTSIWGITGRD